MGIIWKEGGLQGLVDVRDKVEEGTSSGKLRTMKEDLWRIRSDERPRKVPERRHTVRCWLEGKNGGPKREKPKK